MKANAPLWIVSLGQGGGDAAAVGGPGAPVFTDQGKKVIKFNAGEEGAAGPTLGYGVSIEPEGPTLEVQVTNPSVGGQVVLYDTVPFTDYVVTIYGVNVAGRGKSSSTDPFQLNWNEATGGTVSTFTLSGSTYRRHIFTSSATFNVLSNPQPWDITLIAGGGGGGAEMGGQPGWSGGGGGGYFISVGATTLTGGVGVTVGAGGVGGFNTAAAGKGGSSTVVGVGSVGGGGGGNRGSDGWSGTCPGIAGTWGGTSNGASCPGQDQCPAATPGAPFNILRDGVNLGSYGNYGNCGYSNPQQAGTQGVVVIEYKIG
jgi:hypothetical protein